MTDDPFKAALEAALAEKRPKITDEMRHQAIKMLAQSAERNQADKARLIELVFFLGAENPAETAESWIAAQDQEIRDIVSAIPESTLATARPQPATSDNEWPAQRWRGPPDKPLPDRGPAITTAMNGNWVEVSDLERHQAAERLRERQQEKYQSPLERGLGWLRR